MNRQMRTVGGCIGALVGVALLLDVVANVYASPGPCDHTYASASVGSCGQPTGGPPGTTYHQCLDATTSDQCVPIDSIIWVQVQQDFPTNCLSDPNSQTNCNSVDSPCWRSCECEWSYDYGVCLINLDGNFGIWTSKPKKTTQDC